MQIDHKGNKFNSVKAMVAYWQPSLSVNTFYSRLRSKWSLQDALETKSSKYHTSSIPAMDDKGNTFNSISEMARYYGISVSGMANRINKGIPVSRGFASK